MVYTVLDNFSNISIQTNSRQSLDKCTLFAKKKSNIFWNVNGSNDPGVLEMSFEE